jgi:hypothetical protein
VGRHPRETRRQVRAAHGGPLVTWLEIGLLAVAILLGGSLGGALYLLGGMFKR